MNFTSTPFVNQLLFNYNRAQANYTPFKMAGFNYFGCGPVFGFGFNIGIPIFGCNIFPMFGSCGIASRSSKSRAKSPVKKKNKPHAATPPKTTKTKPTPQAMHTKTASKIPDLRRNFVTTARKYMGYNEADGSSRLISKSPEWCADFIKYVLEETFAQKGAKLPPGLKKKPAYLICGSKTLSNGE